MTDFNNINYCFIINLITQFFLVNISGKQSNMPRSHKSDCKMEKSVVSFMQEQNIIYLFIYLLPCKNLNCKSWWDIELCNADKIQAISFNKDKIDPINILE